jgi:hypothetical protein
MIGDSHNTHSSLDWIISAWGPLLLRRMDTISAAFWSSSGQFLSDEKRITASMVIAESSCVENCFFLPCRIRPINISTSAERHQTGASGSHAIVVIDFRYPSSCRYRSPKVLSPSRPTGVCISRSLPLQSRIHKVYVSTSILSTLSLSFRPSLPPRTENNRRKTTDGDLYPVWSLLYW